MWNENDLSQFEIFKNWLLLKVLLTKLLTDPNGSEDLLVYMMIQYDFFIPKIKKQPAIQDPNDPQGPANAAAIVMLLIIYIFIFIS